MIKTKCEKFSGFTLLELIVTLVLVGMVIAAVIQILQGTQQQSVSLSYRLEQLDAAEHSMDMLVEDLAHASANSINVQISDSGNVVEAKMGKMGDSGDGLSIFSYSDPDRTQLLKRVDWMAVPDDEEPGEMVLYRRETIKEGKVFPMYIPMCSKVCTFNAVKDEEGLLVEVEASLYLDDSLNPNRVMRMSRTFCLERFSI
ncbi:MAG: type II secretion system protein [Sedimentisphaerales bacterium]|nr:type II secretion system protein [Sedimentisphaerales bacterium]